jgi:hypothetical protein
LHLHWVTLALGARSSHRCETIKDKRRNGGRNFAALITHVSEDKQVLWGWSPGGERSPVSVPHDEYVARFKEWAAAVGPWM